MSTKDENFHLIKFKENIYKLMKNFVILKSNTNFFHEIDIYFWNYHLFIIFPRKKAMKEWGYQRRDGGNGDGLAE